MEVFVMVLFFNLIADYFSLLQTRLFIQFMEKTERVLGWIGYLLLDFIITGIIFFTPIYLVYSLALLEGTGPSLDFFTILSETFIDGFSLKSSDDSLAIPLLTTYATSLWLWIYTLSGLIIKGVSLTDRGVVFLKQYRDIEKRPFRSIGVVATLLISLIWGITIMV